MDTSWGIAVKSLFYHYKTLPDAKAKRTRLVLYALLGGVFGYTVLHPFSMFVFSSTDVLGLSPLEAVRMSFHRHMWAMGVWYASLGALVGWGVAVLVNRMRVVEGLVPICAWCGMVKVKSDNPEEGFTWKRLDKYLAEKGVEETHGLCPACFEKLKAKLARRGQRTRRIKGFDS